MPGAVFSDDSSEELSATLPYSTAGNDEIDETSSTSTASAEESEPTESTSMTPFSELPPKTSTEGEVTTDSVNPADFVTNLEFVEKDDFTIEPERVVHEAEVPTSKVMSTSVESSSTTTKLSRSDRVLRVLGKGCPGDSECEMTWEERDGGFRLIYKPFRRPTTAEVVATGSISSGYLELENMKRTSSITTTEGLTSTSVTRKKKSSVVLTKTTIMSSSTEKGKPEDAIEYASGDYEMANEGLEGSSDAQKTSKLVDTKVKTETHGRVKRNSGQVG